MKLAAHLDNNQYPTPVYSFKNYFTDHPQQKVWIKRDDLSGLELSGNKVRKLDFLLKEAQQQGARRVITCGGLQSNHCRSTAFYAAKLGMKTTLVLRGEEPQIAQGNYFLNRLLDVDIRFVSDEAYEEVESIMRDIAHKSAENCYIIPEGGSNETGSWGYVNCFNEIRRQMQEMQLHFDSIVFATGSGGTHSGLLLGKLMSGSSCNIISVNVCEDAPFFVDKIDKTMHGFCERYDYQLNWQRADIKIIDGFTGEGYGIISDRETRLIKQLAQMEGIVIDPVYGAKAFLGFEEHLRAGKIPGENILFIHTGGVFSVFPYWEQFKK